MDLTKNKMSEGELYESESDMITFGGDAILQLTNMETNSLMGQNSSTDILQPVRPDNQNVTNIKSINIISRLDVVIDTLSPAQLLHFAQYNYEQSMQTGYIINVFNEYIISGYLYNINDEADDMGYINYTAIFVGLMNDYTLVKSNIAYHSEDSEIVTTFDDDEKYQDLEESIISYLIAM